MKHILSLFFISVLASCLLTSEENDGIAGPDVVLRPGTEPIPVSWSRDPEPYILDAENSRYAIVERYEICEDSALFLTKYDSSWTNYKLEAGKLLTWTSWDCYAKVYEGSSNSLEGTWAVSDGTLEVAIPGDGDYNDCDSEEPYITKGNREVTYSAGTLTRKFSQNYCWATEDLSFYAEEIEGAVITNTGCNVVNFALDNSTASFKAIYLDSDERQEMEFSSGGKSCRLNLPAHSDEKSIDELTQTSCTNAWNDYLADTSENKYFSYYRYSGEYSEGESSEEESKDPREIARDEFEKCVRETGFFGENVPDFF